MKNTKKIILELPPAKATFLENYAREHGMSIAELIGRYIQQLQSSTENIGHPELQSFIGIIPEGVNVRQLYQDYLLEKYR